MEDKLKYIDDEILALLRKDNVQAINKLYEIYFDRMIRIAFRSIGDNETAKDIVQELFLSIWFKRHQLLIKKPIISYLTRAVLNRCLNHLRDERKNQNLT